MATPHALTAALAILPSLVDLPGQALGVPLAAVAIVAVQVVGVFLARELEFPAWRRVWLTALTTTVVLLPLAALQTAASRVPFVSLALGSAGPLLWSTAAVVVGLVGLVLLTAVVAADAPEQASLLFAPAALLVPAILAAPGDHGERSALAALAEASGLAALAVFVGWLLPRGARLLVAPVALGLQFGILWLLGYGPAFPPGHGVIVPVLASLVVVVTVLSAVLVPLAARATSRVLRAARLPPPPDAA